MPLLEVGCNLQIGTVAPTAFVLQVAPLLDDPASCVLDESWSGHVPPLGEYHDIYGNRCHRMTIQPGDVVDVSYRAKVRVSALPDPIEASATEIHPIDLPGDVLMYTLPSRYCLPDELGREALDRYGHLTPGWSRVQAVMDDVHDHLSFRYGSSTPSSTAVDVFHAGEGVCRDFTHLGITMCRALNIPARYVMGFIPDIGVPPPDAPQDFCAWLEVYLADANGRGGWHTFDPRNNERRIGRVPIARGRDAVDTAIMTSYGRHDLLGFEVIADEIHEDVGSAA